MSKYDDFAVELTVVLLRKIADRMEDDPVFAQEAVEEARAIREAKLKQLKKMQKASKIAESKLVGEGKNQTQGTGERSSPGKKFKETATPEIPEIYAIYMTGEEQELRYSLEQYELEVLRGIVSKNHLDSSGKVRKWKTRSKIIDFIVDTVKNRLSQGDAFKS